MNVTNEVYLKADPSKRGIIIHAVMDKGVRKMRVAWFGGRQQPSDHVEDELELVEHMTNRVDGDVSGTVIQARNIEGGVHFRGK